MIYDIELPCSTTFSIECRFPEALAVIEGNNPGWVFADDLLTPRAALVWAQGIEGFYLVGDARRSAFIDDFDFHITQVLEPRLRSLGHCDQEHFE